jgi:glycosyltransferase involved in cell wall biosynthesis
MKILSINNTADIYGASRCMERVFGRLAQDGHEVHAVLPQAGPLVPMLEARGIRVHLHPGLSIIDRAQIKSIFGLLRFLIGFPLSIFFLVRLIRRMDIDIVHTNTVVMPSPSVAALLTGTPHVWHVRELLHEFGSLWRPYQHCVYRLSSSIIAISACVRDQFAPRFQDKIQVVYDGLDTAAFATDPTRVAALRAQFPPEAQLIGIVGRIKWHRKGQEVLVRAASILHERHPKAHYVFVGSPSPGNEDHETRLRELISTCALDDVVHLLGDTDDPASVFAALDIAVAPPIQPEPFGCIVIESMAVGTPVVGSCAGGIAEQIIPYETGLLFTPGSAEELSRDISLLLNNADLRARMSEAGKRRVKSHFSLEATCGSMARIFDQLLHPQPKLGHNRATASSTRIN